MSLLRDIQNELARSDVDVTAVLRKCKILAARLKSAEFAQWIGWELEGYPQTQALPAYRRLSITYYGSFMNSAWSIQKAPIPIQIVPQKFRDAFSAVEFRDGIAKVVSLSKASGILALERPDLIFAVQGECYPEMECLKVWGETSASDFHQVISAVTSRLLDFSLKLEVENPDAGEAPPSTEPVPRDKLTPLVQNIFYGSVGSIAQNSDNFTQQARIEIAPEDLLRFVTNFRNHLSELNLDERQKDRAKAQLATLETESHSQPDHDIVKQAGQTLRNITEGAIGSLIATATQPTVWSWIHEMLKRL